MVDSIIIDLPFDADKNPFAFFKLPKRDVEFIKNKQKKLGEKKFNFFHRRILPHFVGDGDGFDDFEDSVLGRRLVLVFGKHIRLAGYRRG